MKTWHFKAILLNDGWLKNAYVSTDKLGCIQSISNLKPEQSIKPEFVNGYAIPGFQNAHSHAFQYAMAGLAEIHMNPEANDDFWSWRHTMYQIALQINPDELESVATMLYAEMLKHGYTSVAEFHYLHHDKDGKEYSHLAEMGERLIAAAQTAGIRITLVPIFYQQGGFKKEAQKDQRRFLSRTTNDYHRLIEATERIVSTSDNAKLAVGIHSLRAVNPVSISETFKAYNNIPLHIHISEQLKEIDDCVRHYGLRPVAWLLENAPVSENTHLVHATHIDQQETKGIADCGAHVVLCPSTEGNLGDGLFPLKEFQDLGGKWSIGTDSHIGLNPLEELRWLDYGQRLTKHRRNNFTSNKNGNSGTYSVDQALISGRRAMGNNHDEYFGVGQALDAVVLDADAPLLNTCAESLILPTAVYAGDCSMFKGTIVGGDWKVKELIHVSKESIAQKFKEAIHQIGIR